MTNKDTKTQLHEVLAVEKGEKNRFTKTQTELHRLSSKAELFFGLVRSYTPKDEDGERLPDEKQHVQQSVSDVLATLQKHLTEMMDITAQKDWANTKAKASIEVDGKVLLADVPVTYLLYLEKVLNDLETFARALPTLLASVAWTWSDEQNCFVSDPVQTNRTAKTPTVITLAPATDKHQATTHMEYVDKAIGVYTTTKLSTAMGEKAKAEMIERIVKVKNAVKVAREKANGEQAPKVSAGAPLLSYVFGR